MLETCKTNRTAQKTRLLDRRQTRLRKELVDVFQIHRSVSPLSSLVRNLCSRSEFSPSWLGSKMNVSVVLFLVHCSAQVNKCTRFLDSYVALTMPDMLYTERGDWSD